MCGFCEVVIVKPKGVIPLYPWSSALLFFSNLISTLWGERPCPVSQRLHSTHYTKPRSPLHLVKDTFSPRHNSSVKHTPPGTKQLGNSCYTTTPDQMSKDLAQIVGLRWVFICVSDWKWKERIVYDSNCQLSLLCLKRKQFHNQVKILIVNLSRFRSFESLLLTDHDFVMSEKLN